MAKRIEVLLGEISGDPRNIVLNEKFDFSDAFDAAFAELLWLIAF